jgi:ABC-type amino acid transport substrate-binding protein
MKNDRRLWLSAGSTALAGVLPALADEGMEAIRKRGSLRVAVYNDFPPYATAGGKGIDADIARAIAGKLGLTAQVVGYNAGEDMNDDLRNMVWKGHYMGTPPSDMMMHVPVDEYWLAPMTRSVFSAPIIVKRWPWRATRRVCRRRRRGRRQSRWKSLRVKRSA